MTGLGILYLITTGVGVWGENNSANWAWDITNFVFWIGIGHAGTMIAAILYLTRQRWATGINRAAEAMTIFAVMCAGIYPGVHVGRVWFAWYLAPIPNGNAIWPNFRSPLLWDVFAVSTYLSVSIMFWYVGLIPDAAAMRDRVKNKIVKYFYAVFCLGWRGSARQWANYEFCYLMLAGIATLLVITHLHRGVERLLHLRHPRLARHDLHSLLRRRRHLRRLLHAHHPARADPRVLQAARTSSRCGTSTCAAASRC